MLKDSASTPRLKVLLVEDELSHRRTLTAILRDEGFDVTACDTVDEGISLAVTEEYPIAIVDLRLPGREGLHLPKELAHKKGKPRVIIHTAHVTLATVKAGLNLGVFAYVEKLSDPRELIGHVHRAATDHLNQTLRNAEEEIRLQFRLLDAVQQSVIATNLKGDIVYLNRFAESMYGWSVAETLGRNVAELWVPQDDCASHRASIESVTNGKSWSGEVRVLRRDGSSFPARHTDSPIYDSKGRLVGIVGISADISAEKEAQQLLWSHARQQSVAAELGRLALTGQDLDVFMQQLSEALAAALDLEYVKVLEWLPRQNRFLLRAGVGWQAGLVGTTMLASLAEYALRIREPVIIEDLSSETRFEVPSLLLDHHVVSGMSVIITGNNQPFGMLGVHSRRARRFTKYDVDFVQVVANLLADAIERHQALQRWRALFDYSLDPILLVDNDGKFVDVNAAGCALVGYTHDELCRMSFWDLTPERNQELTTRLWHSLLKAGHLTGEYVLVHKDGTEVVVEFSAVANVLPDLHCANLRDVTSRKRTEALVRQQQHHLAHVQRTATMDQMAVALAHELNQPLGAVCTFAGGLLQALPTTQIANGELLKVLEQIHNQALRAGDIVRRLKRFVSRSIPKTETVDLNQIIRDTEQLIHNDFALHGTKVRLELQQDLPAISADSVQIQQVLVNLLKNAVEAMEGLPEDERQITIRTSRAHGLVEATVVDCGGGLSPQDLARAFEPYYTTKPDGLGMGLSISGTIVENHRGKLDAFCNADRGMTFRFRLPLAASGSDKCPTVKADPRALVV